MKKLLANWGNYPVMESDEKSFAFEDELGRLVKDATSFIARGNGRCYGDAALAALTISTLKFDKILAFDPVQGIFECQSGILLDSILRVILPRGWFLPVTPGTKYITAGGAVASDIHGKNHHVEGSFSRHILELGLMLSSGDQIICSPQINPDLFEATCGGMGLTGIICRIKFRLKKVETAFIRQNKIRAENLDELIRLLETHKEATYTVAWIDCLQKGKQHGRGIVFTGEHALPSDLPETMSGDPFILPKKPVFNLPAYLPSWIINPLTVRSFNFLYYHKDRNKVTSRIVGYEPFFYPLDSVGHWNRAYGKRGFLQYQFVIPLHARGSGRDPQGNQRKRNGLLPDCIENFWEAGKPYFFSHGGFHPRDGFSSQNRSDALAGQAGPDRSSLRRAGVYVKGCKDETGNPADGISGTGPLPADCGQIQSP